MKRTNKRHFLKLVFGYNLYNLFEVSLEGLSARCLAVCKQKQSNQQNKLHYTNYSHYVFRQNK